MMTFTERVTEELRAQGMEPVNLASELCKRGQKITVAAIDRWVAEGVEPRLSTAIVTSKILGFSLDDLEPREAALASSGQ